MNNPKIDAIIRHNNKEIAGFFYEYRWLSNFALVDIEYEGLVYPSTENAYQAAKTLDIKEREKLVLMAPNTAKGYGRAITIRPNWNNIRLDVMLDITRKKYQVLTYKLMLSLTKDKYLEETNWWNDKFWGVCNGVGENNLGKIIMKVRQEIY